MPTLIKITPPKRPLCPGYLTISEIRKTLPVTRQAWEKYSNNRKLVTYEISVRRGGSGPTTIRCWKLEDVMSYQTQRTYTAATPDYIRSIADQKQRQQTVRRASAAITSSRMQIIPPPAPPRPTRPLKAPVATVKPAQAPARPKAPAQPKQPSQARLPVPTDMDRLLYETGGDVHKIAARIFPDQYRLRTQRPRPSSLAD